MRVATDLSQSGQITSTLPPVCLLTVKCLIFFLSFTNVSFLGSFFFFFNVRYDIDSKSPDLAKHVSEVDNC